MSSRIDMDAVERIVERQNARTIEQELERQRSMIGQLPYVEATGEWGEKVDLTANPFDFRAHGIDNPMPRWTIKRTRTVFVLKLGRIKFSLQTFRRATGLVSFNFIVDTRELLKRREVM